MKRSSATHGQTRAVAEIVPTLLAAPLLNVMTGNKTGTQGGRRGEVAASRVRVTAVKAGATQATIQTKTRRVMTVLVTTGSETTRTRTRDEARATNVVAKVVTPQVTALTPHRPLTLNPGLLTIVVVPDIGLLGAVNAHLRVLGK